MSNKPVLSKISTSLIILVKIAVDGACGWLVEVLFHNLSYKIIILLLLIIGTVIIFYFNAIRTKIKKYRWYQLTSGSFILFVVSALIFAYFSNQHLGQNKLGFYFKGNHLYQDASDTKIKERLSEDQLIEDCGNETNLVYSDIATIEKKFFWSLICLFIFLDTFICSYLQLEKFNRKKIVKIQIE
jgi:hypothetical protein